MKNTIEKAFELSVTVSIEFENLNFVVAALGKTIRTGDEHQAVGRIYSAVPLFH